MIQSPVIPVTLATQNQAVTVPTMPPQVGAIVVFNDSPYTLSVNLSDARNEGVKIPAFCADKIMPGPQFGAAFMISTKADLLATQPALTSVVYVRFYGASEPVPGIYPMMLNRMTGVGNQQGSGQTYDAILEASPLVALNTLIAQTFALTAEGLNITSVSPTNPGYLILDYLSDNNGRTNPIPFRGNKEPAFLSQTITVPGSTSGNLQTFTITASGLNNIIIFTLPAGVTIGDISIKRSSDPIGSFQTVVPGTVGTNSEINLQNFFGPDGFTTFNNAAIDVRFSSNNSNAGAANYSMQLSGYLYEFDYADLLISYVDWNSNVYDLTYARLGQPIVLPLNFLVPIPITNPAQTNFGSIRVTVLGPTMGGGITFYNTHYTFDFFIPCIVSQLAPS